MTTKLYLIRHGETEWNIAGRFQGQIDIPLNEKGLWQAERLAEGFETYHGPLDRVFSSDLSRAHQTANYLARKFNLPVQIYTTLRERSYGRLEGMSIEEVYEKYPDRPKDLGEVEGLEVEHFTDLQRRIFQQIKQFIQLGYGEQIAIVSHGGTINAFLSYISEGEIGTGVTKLFNTSVTQVETDGESWQIFRLNDVSHLESK